MIKNFDDIVIGLSDVIDSTAPLLRNKKLFCDAIEIAFFNLECKTTIDVRNRIAERVKDGMELLFPVIT